MGSAEQHPAPELPPSSWPVQGQQHVLCRLLWSPTPPWQALQTQGTGAGLRFGHPCVGYLLVGISSLLILDSVSAPTELLLTPTCTGFESIYQWKTSQEKFYSLCFFLPSLKLLLISTCYVLKISEIFSFHKKGCVCSQGLF